MAPEVAEYIAGSLASVRSVPVKNTPIPLAQLGVRPPVKKEVRLLRFLCDDGGGSPYADWSLQHPQMQSVEASMRLDAVASAGMGMSRGKLKDMIEGGDVLVNWKEVRCLDICVMVMGDTGSVIYCMDTNPPRVQPGHERQLAAQRGGHRDGPRQGPAGDPGGGEDVQGQVPGQDDEVRIGLRIG